LIFVKNQENKKARLCQVGLGVMKLNPATRPVVTGRMLLSEEAV
jgi:hypothetical protein